MQSLPLESGACQILITGESRVFVYVPITRCASTRLRNALAGRPFDLYNWQWSREQDQHIRLPNPERVRYLVVLRDPVIRWISGQVEFWRQRDPDPQFWSAFSAERLFDRVCLDVHTLPQKRFLTHIDMSQTTWLWCHHDILHNSWFKDNGITLQDTNHGDMNVSATRDRLWFAADGTRGLTETPGSRPGVLASEIQQRLRDMLDQHSRGVERIREFYREDYELIDSVEFYGSSTAT